jgi:pyrimidine oxygenase
MSKDLQFGVFLPMAKGGWIISENAPPIDGSFELNKRVAVLSDQLGYDFILSMMKWRGYGGRTDHWGASLESMMLMSALSQVTTNIKIWATVHTLLHNPAVIAKMIATLDQMSHGRAGMNIVSGAYKGEFSQMGAWRADLGHDRRYDMASEWIEIVTRLWTEPRVDFKGEFFEVLDCVSEPKPLSKPRPTLICAGMSEIGLRYTCKYADAAFVAGSTEDEIASISRRTKEIAAEYGKPIKTFAMYTIIPGDTDADARKRVEHYAAGTDHEAVAGMMASYGLKPDGRETALVSRSRQGFMTTYLDGSVATIADKIESTVKTADLDGMMLIFPDFINDLELFGKEVLPDLRQRFS